MKKSENSEKTKTSEEQKKKQSAEEGHAEEEHEVASYTEIFLRNKLAPELLSPVGKASVVFIFFIWTIIAVFGFLSVEIEFSNTFYSTNDSMPLYRYNKAMEKHFPDDGEIVTFFTELIDENANYDFLSEESQLKMLEFDDVMTRCSGCTKTWMMPGTLESWNKELYKWIDEGKCEYVPQGYNPFTKVIEKWRYKACLDIWLKEDRIGRTYKEDLKVKVENG